MLMNNHMKFILVTLFLSVFFISNIIYAQKNEIALTKGIT